MAQQTNNGMTPYVNAWSKATPETAPNLILTGRKTVAELTPSHLIDALAPYHHVLDFGCGIGRNTFPLADRFHEVTAYDFPNMIAMLKDDPRYPTRATRIHTETEWGKIRCQTFDAVFASLVLQHLPIPTLLTYLEGLSKMAAVLLVHSRAYLDYKGGLVLDQIARYFKFMKATAVTNGVAVGGMSDKEICKAVSARGEAHYVAWFVPLG